MKPIVFHENTPAADIGRLAELEQLAKLTDSRFYTLEVTHSLKITISYHSDKIFNRRIEGGVGVPFELVLDEALKELKLHIQNRYRTQDAKP